MKTVGWNWRGEGGYMHDKGDSASSASVKVEVYPSGLYLRKAIRIDRRTKQLNGTRVKKKAGSLQPWSHEAW